MVNVCPTALISTLFWEGNFMMGGDLLLCYTFLYAFSTDCVLADVPLRYRGGGTCASSPLIAGCLTLRS